ADCSSWPGKTRLPCFISGDSREWKDFMKKTAVKKASRLMRFQRSEPDRKFFNKQIRIPLKQNRGAGNITAGAPQPLTTFLPMEACCAHRNNERRGKCFILN